MESFGRLAVCSMLLCLTSISSTLHTIAPTQPLRDNHNETLVSPGGVFEAGFFSPDDPMSRYLGIWYKSIPERTIVWVANRDKPIYDTSGVLKIDSGRGILGIFHSKGIEIWSSNTSKKAEKPILQLLDSGNLVLRDDNNLQSILWQSFDYPGDTFLPGMKIGSNLRTGQYLALTSWKSPQDPTPGEFSMLINTTGLPQLVITQGGGIINRVGSWNGVGLTGNAELNTITFLKFFFELSEDEVFYRYQVLNSSVLTRAMISPQGYLLRYTWSSQTNRWNLSFSSQFGQCEIYASCGANTNCYVNSSKNCECLRGFTASEEGGCVRTTPLECNKVDSFQKYRGIKLPDTSSSWYDKSMHLGDCEKLCLRNCSCTAYSSLYISDGGSGCLHWFGDIVDLTQLAEGGQAFYIRVPTNMTVNNRTLGKKKIAGIMVGCIIFIMGIVVLGLTLWIQKTKLTQPGTRSYWKNKRNKEDFDLPIFAFSTISNATNQFSESNKLGQGGFGPVYKVGILADGQEIAVKRLSETSKQGMDEFKNEVLLIAKLQHRNLVKLLGCTIQQDEKLLIYEFLPNRSLDYFIFDSVKSKLLDWAKRFQIIDGIARGLLYLHHDSRLIIIHRDLKAGNILLDKNMSPKISDFGLARTFGGDEVEAHTNRAMGTYGYMPPEYVMHGDFSIKSDVYSFGVIVLEIISGRKIRGFCDSHHHLNLLGHAWRLWIEARPIELMDELLHDSATITEVLRCIQVGLLCVQQRPEDRPNMSTVVLMLNGEKLLPKPRQPGFYTGKDNPSSTQIDSTTKSCQECSANEISSSLFEAR